MLLRRYHKQNKNKNVPVEIKPAHSVTVDYSVGEKQAEKEIEKPKRGRKKRVMLNEYSSIN